MQSYTCILTPDFRPPSLFTDPQIDPRLREIAMVVGAQAVKEVMASGVNQDSVAACQKSLIEERKRLEKLEGLLRESQSAELKHREKMLTLQEEVEHRIQARLAEEKARLIEQARREAQQHESMLATQMQQRHAAELARCLTQGSAEAMELRSMLKSLREEHEGLVVKLMTRLEPSSASARGGSGSTTSAAALGRTFEENVERYLRQAFGAREGFTLEDVHSTGHCGDFLMLFDGLRIMIELKSYDPRTRVPTKEVEKFARDLAEVEPRCDAGIMISACSEITGHYSCGPLEVSASVACVPVLFINNFLALGEPQVTLHMTRVFLSMVHMVSKAAKRIESTESALLPENREACETERIRNLERATTECARRCTGYLSELNRQSTDLLKQVTVMKTGATKLRESVVALVECEVARISGLIQLMTPGSATEGAPSLPNLDRTVFSDPLNMSDTHRKLCARIMEEFEVSGGVDKRCATKDILAFIQGELEITSAKGARDVAKMIFAESAVKHGYIVGLAVKGVPSSAIAESEI